MKFKKADIFKNLRDFVACSLDGRYDAKDCDSEMKGFNLGVKETCKNLTSLIDELEGAEKCQPENMK
jgi:hypothetical protein